MEFSYQTVSSNPAVGRAPVVPIWLYGPMVDGDRTYKVSTLLSFDGGRQVLSVG
ncbi:MAG: hypothetical protein AAFN40_06815 [Cyanobacteria bacterium J06560_6]